MKVVDIERVVILMRFIQYGWNEERKKGFDDSLRIMLETQCEDLEEHDKQIRANAIDECIKKLSETEDTILSDRQYYTLEQLKEQK